MSALRKPNLAMFNDSDDEEPVNTPQSKPKVNDAKIQHFTSGSVRKSRKDKEREAAEAKAREEEERAKAAYAEFLDDFATGPSEKREGKSFVRAGESSAGPPATRSHGEFKAKMMWEEDKPDDSGPALGSARLHTKGRRAMDSFLEEIKRDQQIREERLKRTSQTQGSSVTALAAFETQRGSRDVGDPETTNVFVASLPAGVTEQSLGTYFAKCGPVGSVKIMWPRHEDGPSLLGGPPTGPRRQTGLSGFVCFMKRRDAEAAVTELDGQEWNGATLRVGWSKAVSVPQRAMFDLGPGLGAKRGRSRSPERHKLRHSRSRSRSPRRETVGRDRDRERSPESRKRRYSESRSRSRSPVRRKYRDDSRTPERSRSREARRRRSRSPDERGRDKTPDLVPFDEDGANSIYSTDSGEESERENHRKGTLAKLALGRFESMLRGTTGKRGEIARLMGFALDHADAATEVASIILRSLQVDSTPVPRKVARLHLVCDILHNSAASVPNAWKFRQEFESGLGQVFDHLSTIYDSFPGRITAETFKKQITNVLDVWEDWIVFPPDKTQEYRRRLDGNATQEPAAEEEEEVEEEKIEEAPQKPRFKASVFRPAAETAEDVNGAPIEELDGAPLDDVDGAPIDDVDGAPMEDVDGASLEDGDGAPIEDLVDGAPIQDVDGAPFDGDVDGAPIEEDVDGAPFEDIDGAPINDEDVDEALLEADAAISAVAAAAVSLAAVPVTAAVEEDEEEDMAIEDD
ncbi:hypothetical protein CALVIDRAFT_535077 [Calocera viscosa TUFC12733]|uniref:CID domain-containing protein n=1 Tax=Calocera viscosa (strain TUFC12733) TaxID=1330018 RepID=A0A167PNJ4_CALVF|nr:hypothetical protein CALVIDRAFT_535077 [Calocera viscosa TUFC12733]